MQKEVCISLFWHQICVFVFNYASRIHKKSTLKRTIKSTFCLSGAQTKGLTTNCLPHSSEQNTSRRHSFFLYFIHRKLHVLTFDFLYLCKQNSSRPMIWFFPNQNCLTQDSINIACSTTKFTIQKSSILCRKTRIFLSSGTRFAHLSSSETNSIHVASL